MKPEMHTVEEVSLKVSQGQRLLLAGEGSLLQQIPAGNWIGGTIPYFVTQAGGITTKELIYVTELPDYIQEIEIKQYDAETIPQVYKNAPENGFSVIIIPAKSPTHFSFALNVTNFENFATRPLIGWISGVHLDDVEHEKPKVFNGVTAKATEDDAIVLHARLPANKAADIGIINMFEQGDGDTITFPESGFSAKDAFINGVRMNFGEYLRQNRLDKKLPLVTDYFGAMLNTTFQDKIGPAGEVQFYNAVFNFLEYRQAKPIQNYPALFTRKIKNGHGVQAIFSCNCLLNYIYSELEGRQTDCIPGPATFGEVAYQTLNQTMVYLRVIDLHSYHF